MLLKASVTEKKSGVFIISPVGSIDANSYAILEDKVDSVLKESPKVIILDMQGVSYMSSAGIRVILKAQKALKHKEGTLIMVNLQPRVKRVLDIIKALPPQQIFESTEELDAYLDKIQRQI